MLIALCVVAAVVLLLVLHLVAVPLAKKRAVLLRGPEPAVALALFLVCLSIIAPFLWSLLLVQLVVGVVWRPWVAFGITRAQAASAVTKAAGMVRLKVEARGTEFALSTIGSAHATGVGRAQVIGFRVRRTKKLVLFQNVLRKTIQNYMLTVG
jgi:hypothetical protein